MHWHQILRRSITSKFSTKSTKIWNINSYPSPSNNRCPLQHPQKRIFNKNYKLMASQEQFNRNLNLIKCSQTIHLFIHHKLLCIAQRNLKQKIHQLIRQVICSTLLLLKKDWAPRTIFVVTISKLISMRLEIKHLSNKTNTMSPVVTKNQEKIQL